MGFFTFLSKVTGKPFTVKVLKKISSYSRKMSSRAHKAQMDLEWSVPPEPAWFDHYCDLHYTWSATNIPFWVERGVFSLLAMKQGCNVLELCCGDGFNTKHFYSIRAGKIISMDFDPTCIAHARQYNFAPNATYQLGDIRKDMPEGKFENVIFDAALAYFTEAEIETIMRSIKARLSNGGIMSGCSIAEKGKNKQLSHHVYEFKSKEDLKRFLEPYFKNVVVFETIYPTRHNLYFYASDEALPFSTEWEFMTKTQR